MSEEKEPFKLVQICGACPESYKVYLNDEEVGYMKLRHGYFYAEHSNGQTVYEANTRGDGVFESEERDFHIGNALAAIRAKIEEAPQESWTVEYKDWNEW